MSFFLEVFLVGDDFVLEAGVGGCRAVGFKEEPNGIFFIGSGGISKCEKGVGTDRKLLFLFYSLVPCGYGVVELLSFLPAHEGYVMVSGCASQGCMYVGEHEGVSQEKIFEFSESAHV